MVVKLYEIKSRKELEDYVVHSRKRLSCSKEGFDIYWLDRNDNAIDTNLLSTGEYIEIFGFKPYKITIRFPDDKTKEIIEKIPIKNLENMSCIQISQELGIPFIMVANYKSFLMEILWDLKHGFEFRNLKIDDYLIEEICNFHCKEFKDGLIDDCTYAEKCYY